MFLRLLFVLLRPIITGKCCDRLHEVTFNQTSEFRWETFVCIKLFTRAKHWLWCFKQNR